MTTDEHNSVRRGFLWGMIFWIPLIGQILYAYRVYLVGQGADQAKRAAFVAIFWTLCLWSYPFLGDYIGLTGFLLFLGICLAGFIVVFIIGTKQIGWRFLAGKLIAMLVVFAILTVIAIPQVIDRKQKVAKIQSQQHHNQMVLPSN